MRKKDKREDDKYIAGTIESQYDHYLSSEEEVDEKEEKEQQEPDKEMDK